ncbi:tetratricopeptide repeat protein [Pseudobutyrivibrio ruminis]|uniref:tetratricopeptide repeat protein n=1 Tax=Pseudobutyrivibrio ruminis TaxID=46206 RepID=UPI00040B8C5E|nr:SEL1-like repeat protein [Pseudobutyrivibrio ruminis]
MSYSFKDKEYDNLVDFAVDYSIPLIDLRIGISRGRSLEAILNSYRNYNWQHKIQIDYKDIRYNSFSAFCRAMNIKQSKAYWYYKSLMSIEEIINECRSNKPNPQHIQIDYNGGEYPSISSFCKANELDYGLTLKLLGEKTDINEVVQIAHEAFEKQKLKEKIKKKEEEEEEERLEDYLESIRPKETETIVFSSIEDNDYLELANRYLDLNDYFHSNYWIMQAALVGNAEAQYKIGCFFENKGTEKGSALAVKWFIEATKGSNPDAYSKLAKMFYEGKSPCKLNKVKAKNCWISAYILNPYGGYDNKLSKFFPGWQKENNPKLVFRSDTPISLIKEYAKVGIPDAQYWLAIDILNGSSVGIKRKLKAKNLLLSAAIYNHEKAIKKLTEYYAFTLDDLSIMAEAKRLINGKSEEEIKLGFYYLNMAKTQGVSDAYYYLGICYKRGIGVDRDDALADSCFIKGMNDGTMRQECIVCHGLNCLFGLGTEKNITEAVRLFKSVYEFDKIRVGKLIELASDNSIYTQSKDNYYLYNNDGITIQFIGVNNLVDITQLIFRVYNFSGRKRFIYLKEATINNKRIAFFEEIGEFVSAVDSGDYYVNLKESIRGKSDDVIFSIEINDAKKRGIDSSGKYCMKNIPDVSGMAAVSDIRSLKSGNTEADIVMPSVDYDKNSSFYVDRPAIGNLCICDAEDYSLEYGGVLYDGNIIRLDFWLDSGFSDEWKILLNEMTLNDVTLIKKSDCKDIVLKRKSGDGDWINFYYEIKNDMCLKEGELLDIKLVLSIYKYDYYFMDDVIVNINSELVDINSIKHSIIEMNSLINDKSERVQRSNETKPSIDELLRAENSFCKRIVDEGKLEIYFSDMPSSFIKRTLRKQGWRWNHELGCWYAEDSYQHQMLASIIAGEVL